MPVSRPRRFFGFFLIAEKETRPQAKSHCTQFFDPTRRADEDIRPYTPQGTGCSSKMAGDREGCPTAWTDRETMDAEENPRWGG